MKRIFTTLRDELDGSFSVSNYKCSWGVNRIIKRHSKRYSDIFKSRGDQNDKKLL